MYRLLLSQAAFILLITAGAQAPVQFTQENGDCTGAIFITDSIYRTGQTVRGFGNKLEIKENPRYHQQWFEREHHTTWYKFRVPAKCNLTMDIIPEVVTDDIDFIIFEGAIPGICEKITNRQVIPIRSNISRKDPALAARCGLAKEAVDDFVRSGIGSSYSRAMEVEAGQLFYLVIDHQVPPRGGYEIRFHYDPPPPPPVEEPEEEKKAQQHLEINITDAKTGKPLPATLTIDGMRFDKVVEASGKSTYEFDMDMYRNLKIGCTHKGYMFTTLKVKGSTDKVVTVDIKLAPISAGEKVVLDDIRFVGNENKVMRQSEAALLMLLRFMQENPGVRIEVQGHVNGPTFRNKKEFIDLSTERAKTVCDYLLLHEIGPERMTYQGFGNSQMIYPEPRNKEQSEANRRVEIKVLGT